MTHTAVHRYFHNVATSTTSIFEGLAVTMSWMFRRPYTIQYPYSPRDPKTRLGGPETLPERYRGFLEVDMDICSACLACERACPVDCIRIDVEKIVLPNDPEKKEQRAMTRFDIDMAKCMFCGLCSEPCPTGAIRHTQHFESPVTSPLNLLMRFVDPAKPVIPYKVKKGEEPKTKPRGEIAAAMYVNRAWDAPAPKLPDIPRPVPGTSTDTSTATPK
ncbi:MAG: NADH-quinone oxidoreductase subunit I [Deltaproteobacteria bacterium]|nr:NADH-quinone oxidoreductase subunit I [Deltaproteobacteria bacterium]